MVGGRSELENILAYQHVRVLKHFLRTPRSKCDASFFVDDHHKVGEDGQNAGDTLKASVLVSEALDVLLLPSPGGGGGTTVGRTLSVFLLFHPEVVFDEELEVLGGLALGDGGFDLVVWGRGVREGRERSEYMME